MWTTDWRGAISQVPLYNKPPSQSISCFRLLGNINAANPPTLSRPATSNIGIAQFVSTNAPNVKFPKTAPILAISRLVPIAVDLKNWLIRLIGPVRVSITQYNSINKHSVECSPSPCAGHRRVQLFWLVKFEAWSWYSSLYFGRCNYGYAVFYAEIFTMITPWIINQIKKS
jgi:hypothetical protein